MAIHRSTAFTQIPDSWDLVVVGAGSAGAVLAVRCAEQGKRVLLLEAGPDYRSAEMAEAWRSPNPVVALTDPHAAKKLVWPGLLSSRTDQQDPALYLRGRGAGGSSAINAQIAIRPPMEDFDEWASSECPGWSSSDVLPFFAALEDDLEFGEESYHGRGGPTPVHRTPLEEWGAVDVALSRSALRAGFAWAPDVNAPGATGVSPYPINSRKSRRVSVNDAYLEPARTLPNLKVLGDALVDRVLFDGDRAVGVSFEHNDGAREAYAETVVLSAGAIHSPTILMRSGIGPAQHLRTHGIDIRVDLPVGQGLQDHPVALVSLPLTAAARMKTPDDRHTNVCVRWASGPDAAMNDLFFSSLNQNVLAMATTSTGAHSGAYAVWLNRPHSRGQVLLASSAPSVQPQIRQRMLSDARDLTCMRYGVRTLVELARSEDTASILRSPFEVENEALLEAIDSDELLDEHLLATVGDAQHATSTCRMGPADDPTAVVDPACRVHGVQALHVVDASILPRVPRANTNLTAIMIGEAMARRLGSATAGRV